MIGQEPAEPALAHLQTHVLAHAQHLACRHSRIEAIRVRTSSGEGLRLMDCRTVYRCIYVLPFRVRKS
jgi:hypothetical protein